MQAMLTEYVATYGFSAVTYPIAAVFIAANLFIIWRGI